MSPHTPRHHATRADAPRPTPVAVLTAAFAVLVIAGCSKATSEPSTSRTPPPPPVVKAAPYTWSMPARFGQDANHDGLIDYPDSAQIHPASWTVNFDACNITGTHYEWYVDSVSVGTVSTCKYAYQFPTEGTYDVAVNVTGATDTTLRSDQKVVVQDWLVLSIGDSYGSGEGNPDVPMATDTLVTDVEASLRQALTAQQQLAAAQHQLAAAQQSLQAALASKGLAQTAYNNAVQLYQQFQTACSTIISTSCVSFLATEAVSFASLDAARTYFNQIVTNTQQRLTDAETAVTHAHAAVSDAQAAVTSATSAFTAAKAAITRAQAGFAAPKWHAKYSVETYDSLYQCHRSAEAASAQAALALENADPHTSVTFVHLACSGAKIEGGGQAISQQIAWAKKLIGDREIDAVLVSIGGNDIGFSGLAAACVEQQPCYSLNPTIDPAKAIAACAPLTLLPSGGTKCSDFFTSSVSQQSAKQILDSANALLPGRYGDLATQFLPELQGLLRPDSSTGSTAAQRVRSNRVYITQYGSLTKNDASAYCTPDPQDLLGTMPGVTLDEMQWLDQTAEGDLNGDVQSAAAQYGWNEVTGIYAGYAPHGYCAHDHWVTRLDETFLRQGDYQGMMHPDQAGQQFSAGRIEAALLKQLYPNGTKAPPRAPDQSRTGG